MSEERVIVHGNRSMAGSKCSVCIDVVFDKVLLTATDWRDEVQVDLGPSECRRLGEWLIERANQAGERA